MYLKKRQERECPRQLKAVSWTPKLHRSLKQNSKEMSKDETKWKVQ